MNPTPIIAIILGLGAILGGNALEGGSFSSLVQPTAFMIVMGGTIAATWLASTDAELKSMKKMLPKVIKSHKGQKEKLFDQIIEIAKIARKDGTLAIESKLEMVDNPFLHKGLCMLIDGMSAEELEKSMGLEMDVHEHHYSAAGKLLETAGGFAPTIGIIGAVLGLIHVMHNLSDPSKLGEGIAVAFVATVYGVGFANLIFIPLGNRMKKLVAEEVEVYNMILNGLICIASGSNPRRIEETMQVYVPHHKASEEAA